MKKIALLLALTMLLCAVCAPAPADEMLTGGWNMNFVPAEQMDEAAQAAFDKATGIIMGVGYEPLALLSTQVVAGMNYCYLTKAAVIYPDAAPYYAVVYVYADLDGNATITNVETLELWQRTQSEAVAE